MWCLGLFFWNRNVFWWTYTPTNPNMFSYKHVWLVWNIETWYQVGTGLKDIRWSICNHNPNLSSYKTCWGVRRLVVAYAEDADSRVICRVDIPYLAVKILIALWYSSLNGSFKLLCQEISYSKVRARILSAIMLLITSRACPSYKVQ